jgi:hypothetical protein
MTQNLLCVQEYDNRFRVDPLVFESMAQNNKNIRRNFMSALNQMEIFFIEVAFYRALCACRCTLPNLVVTTIQGVYSSKAYSP